MIWVFDRFFCLYWRVWYGKERENGVRDVSKIIVRVCESSLGN